MRSIWKGHIRFSLVTIPIQIFSAVETKKNVRFNQIHSEDHGRVGYKKICKTCDSELGPTDIVKGYQYEKDQYVMFNSEELENVSLKSTRAIDIESFVDVNEVHPSRFEQVYYVGPDGDVAQQPFALICEVMKKSNKGGIGRIILRDKEDVVLLTAEQGGIIMYKLRYPYELRSMEKVPGIGGEIKIDEKQLKLAETLVETLDTDFDKVDFSDRYREALMELVNKKIAGKEIVTVTEEGEDTPVVDIMDALKASIDAAKKKSA